ncbi:MAG: GMC family oxidoreductase [Acidimicrobiales bacterium]
MSDSYDVIIIGAGSAGCPLAARLSEDPSRSVLLLEAGPRFVGVDNLPQELRYGGVLSAMAPNHPNNWGMVATVRNGVLQPLPRGRVVGGSSVVNGTLFTRGLPEDFDRWSAEGNEAWSYERVLPYFKKLENDHDVRDEYHGTTGPVPVRRAAPAEWAPIDLAFAAACRDAGYPDDPDMNGPASIGVGALPVNNVKGIRMNTALAYLDPLENRPNLTVRGDAPVLRVLLEAGRAIGVEVMLGGQVCAIHAGEVVLSAGAVKSPQLLMLSGIGPPDELHRIGVPVVHELSLVGRRFTDHCSAVMRIRVKKRRNPVPDPTLSAWAHFGLHYTSTGSDIYSDMAMLQSAIPINNTMLHGVSLVGRARMLKSAVGTMSLPKLADHVRYGWEHGITCLIMQGASRGEIRLTSSDPSANPDLLYHFLDSAADRSRMREAMRLAAALSANDAYRELGAERIAPTDDELHSDAALDRFLFAHVGASVHMASTCRMGPSPENAVVDQYCRVYGIDGLRVVDTSIMPTVVRRCPAATAVMIGERAAEFFR